MNLPRAMPAALIGAAVFTAIGWALMLAVRYAVHARLGGGALPPLGPALVERAISTAIVGALLGFFYGSLTASGESGSLVGEPSASDVEARLKRDLARQIRTLGPDSTAARPAPAEPPKPPAAEPPQPPAG